MLRMPPLPGDRRGEALHQAQDQEPCGSALQTKEGQEMSVKLEGNVIFRVDGQDVKDFVSMTFGVRLGRVSLKIEGDDSLRLFPVSRKLRTAEFESRNWKMSYQFIVNRRLVSVGFTNVEIDIAGEVSRVFKEEGEQ